MAENKNPIYEHWNGKNPDGKSSVGNSDLISEGPRTSKTGAKYDVSVETLSADDLQKSEGKLEDK